jgi:hypothetical protein
MLVKEAFQGKIKDSVCIGGLVVLENWSSNSLF